MVDLQQLQIGKVLRQDENCLPLLQLLMVVYYHLMSSYSHLLHNQEEFASFQHHLDELLNEEERSHLSHILLFHLDLLYSLKEGGQYYGYDLELQNIKEEHHLHLSYSLYQDSQQKKQLHPPTSFLLQKLQVVYHIGLFFEQKSGEIRPFY